MKSLLLSPLLLLPLAASAGFQVVQPAAPIQASAPALLADATPPSTSMKSPGSAGGAAFGLVAVQYTGEPDPEIGVRNGMGRDMPLAEALRLIVPSGWQVYLSDQVVADMKGSAINWRGGRRWVEVLDVVANDNALIANVVWDKRQVFVEKRPAPTVVDVAEPVPIVAPPPAQFWVAKAGSSLREVVQEWAKSVDWTVQWIPEDLDYSIVGTLVFEGTFENAITDIFGAYDKARRPMQVDGNRKQKLLIVKEKKQ